MTLDLPRTTSADLPEPASNTIAHEKAQHATDSAADSVREQTAPNQFAELGLMNELVRAVEDLGYTQPTAVQAAVIPKTLVHELAQADAKFQDVMVSSQTGSGKTAAFLLPILHSLELQRREQDRQESMVWAQKVAQAAEAGLPPPKKPRRKNPTDPRNFKATTPKALILCPTRELAQQVANDAIDLVQYMKGVRIASVIGGLPYATQIARLQNAAIVVATPGRLLDLERGGQIKLNQLQYLVLDEADRMLDLGFAEDLAAVHELTQQRNCTMMFSATFAPRIQELGARLMRSPQRIALDSPQEKHTNITQRLYWADNSHHRRQLLDHWLRDTQINQAIVFASTQIECDNLAQDLADAGFSAVALHGALSQGLRNRRLNMLRDGRIQFLVATDVAARGIDVSTITHVFNYGLPMKAEDYVHRIGRTGRAGRDGMAITIAEQRDYRRINDIEFYTKQRFTVATVPGLEPQVKAQSPRGKSHGSKKPFSKGSLSTRGRSEGARPETNFGAKTGSKAGWGRAANQREERRELPFESSRAQAQTAGSRLDKAFAPIFEKTPARAQDGVSAPKKKSSTKTPAKAHGQSTATRAAAKPAPKSKTSSSGVNWVGVKVKQPDRRKRTG